MSFHRSVSGAVDRLSPWQQDLILAAVVVLGGYLIMRVGIRTAADSIRRHPRADNTLIGFAQRTISLLGWVVIAVVLLAIVGVNVTGLLGGLAIGGFIVGFALKDTLGNLAAGVMLLAYRPFNVGDWVTIDGKDGGVTQLGMALTTLKAADGRIITLPNGAVLGHAIINHTREPVRRADVLVGISYDDDIDTAIKAIMEELPKDERVLEDPPMDVRITGLDDSSVGLQVRPWVRTEDIWLATAQFHGIVKRAVEDAGCTIPFPQRDVHMHQTPA